MSTEYRRGIPSVAHVEAATRLGLLWERSDEAFTQFMKHQQTGEVLSCHNNNLTPGFISRIPSLGVWPHEHNHSYRPIRTDGTPVDWAVLDAEVARTQIPTQSIVAGIDWARFESRTVTPTTSAAPTTQLQGFRADLWRRICEHFLSERSNDFNLLDIVSLRETSIDLRDPQEYGGQWLTQRPCSADIITRWAVYQELKPLYDIVDGAQGEVAMPRDVELAWAYCVAPSAPFAEGWFLFRDESGLRARLSWGLSWRPEEDGYGVPLRNFAAVLDAVAKQRVAARQGQAQPNTVTLSVGPSNSFQYEAITASPEPRSFADVRPDRHGWRWWRVFGGGCLDEGNRFEVAAGAWRWLRQPRLPNSTWDSELTLELWTSRTVIPTDEQGNPVSWDSIEQTPTRAPVAAALTSSAQPIAEAQGWTVSEFRGDASGETVTFTLPITRDMTVEPAVGTVRSRHVLSSSEAIARATAAAAQRVRAPFGVLRRDSSEQGTLPPGWTTVQSVNSDGTVTVALNGDGSVSHDSLKQQPLPRFTADELDDVDHSATTTQDSATLKRGELPTVEAIGKYREVMAKRNGTVAEAAKASGIDCEVAQYVLERWAGELDDTRLRDLIACVRYSSICTVAEVCAIQSRWGERRPTLDISEPADTAAQRQRAEAAERKARMMALQAQLAKERAARVTEPAEEPTRFSLLEVDEAADPARSIEAWKVQRARNIVRPAAVPASQPTPAPRRKAFEVVDAQAEGLSGTAALAVLLGRAMNGGC